MNGVEPFRAGDRVEIERNPTMLSRLNGRRLDGAVALRAGMEPTIGVMPVDPFSGTAPHHKGRRAVIELAQQLREVIDAPDR